MEIQSSAFELNARIPKQYTGEGANISPPLEFIDVPKDTKSLVLIMDDPDAPGGTFDHWICWYLAPDKKGLVEGEKINNLGKNSYKVNLYKGPFPPPGKPHRYFFKLYALDTVLKLNDNVEKSEVERAIKNHIIAQAKLIGIYER